MSFINMMANDIWSDADITNRTESMVRSEFNQESEGILNRKVTGAVLGVYQMSPEEKAEVGRYQQACEAARQAGAAARADAVLLSATLDYETAARRLAQYRLADGRMEQTIQVPTGEQVLDETTGQMMDVTVEQVIPAIEPLPATVTSYDLGGNPVYDLDGNPVTVPNPAITQDDEERTEAQAVVDGATPEVLDLAGRRAS